MCEGVYVMIAKIDSAKNPSFGMALHMPKTKQIKSVFGYKAAFAAEQAKPELEKFADNVDIFVRLEDSVKTGLKAFSIKVAPLSCVDTAESSILVSDHDSLFTIDSLANYMVKTAKLLKSKFELPPKATPEQMINPDFDPGNNINSNFLLYVAKNRQGYMDDLKKNVKGVDDDFIDKKLLIGYIGEPLQLPEEYLKKHPDIDNRREYFITPAIVNTMFIRGIIKHEYWEQFRAEVKNSEFCKNH